MSPHLPGDRRAAARDTAGSNRATRLVGALRRGLYRPLAEDGDRAAYWVRHVRMGVLLSAVTALSVAGYTVVTETPGRHDPVILGLAAVVFLAVPGLLLLPLRAMMLDSRGPSLFYVWSVLSTIVVVVVTRLDGGSSSPLDGLLFLTLTYMAVAYPPAGVVAMGSVMTGSYLLFVELPGVTTSGLFHLTILGTITTICAMASANSWAAHDRQVVLIRTQEVLAATDPLTGIPNRRAFLERATRAVEDADRGRRVVLCLVDLDGFKAVNDIDGHGAGDAVLVAVAAALGGAVRETDTVARLGGDEFAVLADTSGGSSGEELAERLRAAVARVGGSHGVTASVGLADVAPVDDIAELMHRADAAMYRSKTGGGDRVTTLID